jgi:hypothetical protein
MNDSMDGIAISRPGSLITDISDRLKSVHRQCVVLVG